MISVTQAAELIGITRAAIYKAIEKQAMRALRIGNVTVVERSSALAYRDARRKAPRRRRAERPAPRSALRGARRERG